MSGFGLFHTALSILPIPVGLLAFIRDGKIDPRNRLGQLYVGTMLAGTVSGFGFLLTKGFDVAQVLTIATLLVVLVGAFAGRARWLGWAAPYIETFFLSASYLLLMVFTTTETLTRLPAGHPFAASAEAPELLPVRLALLVAFVVGYGYQAYRLHSTASRPAAGASLNAGG